jgi:RsiW-degrading membrane proteinase PrsW (M82 family)
MLRPDILFALLPVLAFLAVLVTLDSYKLIRFRSILVTILAGCGAALAAMLANTSLFSALPLAPAQYSRYVSPVIEELLKAIFMIALLRANKVGFMVDAAIRGFAIGAGFALVENIYYYVERPDAELYLWVIRGFGTAIMHGGTTAILGITARYIADRSPSAGLAATLPGLAIAIVFHSLFNHFFLAPLLSTVLVLIILPALILVVFRASELGTRKWLGIGFDSDRELLEMITTGILAETRIGRYLQSLQDRFPGETVADMLCYLRLHLELSVNAKGLLLMREAGFEPPPDPEARGHFDELRYLEKSIGPTGMLALHPFLHTRKRDLWQIAMLKN